MAFLVFAIASATTVLVGGCGGGHDASVGTATEGEENGFPSKPPKQEVSASESKGPHCRQAGPPRKSAAQFQKPKQTVTPGETLTAVVTTNCGTFQIALDSKKSPETANSFAFMAEHGFYSGLALDRLIRPGTLLLGGNPPGKSTDAGYHTVEPPPRHFAYTQGVVAMSNGTIEPPGYAGSQFFIVMSKEAPLEPEYALIGRVSKGFAVPKRIERVLLSSGAHKELILIERMSIRRH